jgi:hypothetical protein
MLLNAFKQATAHVHKGLQRPFKDVWLPIQGRLVTHSRTFGYPFKDVWLPFKDYG